MWGLEAAPASLAMISIKGARTFAAAKTAATATAVLAGGVEDIIWTDDLVQKITGFSVLAARRQVEVSAGLRAVLVVALAHGGAVLVLLPSAAIGLHALRHAWHAREIVKPCAGSLHAAALHASLKMERGAHDETGHVWAGHISPPPPCPLTHAPCNARDRTVYRTV